MATTSTGPQRSTVGSTYDDNEHGSGWVSFAGIMIALVGTMNVIYGIAAASNSKFFFHNTTYILSDLRTYGWLNLIFGAIQIAAGVAIFGRSTWARWVGIITASINALIQMTFVSAYPLASLTLLAIDVLVIYGLVVHGKHARASLS